MPQQHNALLIYQEDRIELALQAFQAGHFWSYWRAAAAFNVNHYTLTRHVKGTLSQLKTPVNGYKLTPTKEQTIIQYILDLDSWGFPPRLCEVADMADKLLGARGGEPVGKCWIEQFINCSEQLKMVFTWVKDC